MPVHCYGYPCDVERIEHIADTYGLKVIYDAAHAFGVRGADGGSLLVKIAMARHQHAKRRVMPQPLLARTVEPAAQVAAVVLADAFGPHHFLRAAIDHVLQLQAPALVAGDGGIDVDLGHQRGRVFSVQHQFAAVVFHGPGGLGAGGVLLPDLEQAAEKTHASSLLHDWSAQRRMAASAEMS